MMVFDLKHFRKGSIVLALRSIKIALLKDNTLQFVEAVSRKFDQLYVGTQHIVLQPGESFLLLEQPTSMQNIFEFKCLIREQTRRLYIRQEDFHSCFALYPAAFAENINHSPEDEWLTHWFKVRGNLFKSAWNANPQVVFGDYSELKRDSFMKTSAKGRWTAFNSSSAKKGWEKEVR